jgi:hypothetical protein
MVKMIGTEAAEGEKVMLIFIEVAPPAVTTEMLI